MIKTHITSDNHGPDFFTIITTVKS